LARSVAISTDPAVRLGAQVTVVASKPPDLGIRCDCKDYHDRFGDSKGNVVWPGKTMSQLGD